MDFAKFFIEPKKREYVLKKLCILLRAVLKDVRSVFFYNRWNSTLILSRLLWFPRATFIHSGYVVFPFGMEVFLLVFIRLFDFLYLTNGTNMYFTKYLHFIEILVNSREFLILIIFVPGTWPASYTMVNFSYWPILFSNFSNWETWSKS